MTVLSYLKMIGGAHKQDDSYCKENLGYFHARRGHNYSRISYGKNAKAGLTCRNFQDFSECLLSAKIFHRVSQRWRIAEIDLYTSRACYQILAYMACHVRARSSSQAADTFL